METIYTVYQTDGSSEEINDDLPEQPGFDALRRLVSPLLGGGEIERVRIWHTELGAYTDMFVREAGALDNLPINPTATSFYWANVRRHGSAESPNNGPSIHGPAVVFHRRVWY